MLITKALVGSLALLAATTLHAQYATPRQQFEAGATAYLKEGAAAAIAAWLKGSALEGNTQATSQANGLRQIEDFYGKPEGFEVFEEIKLGDRSNLLFGVVNFQKGPMYARFQTFRLATGQWVSTEFKVHTDVTQLFPDRVMLRR